MQSGQKDGLEQAHTILRMILPKGTSFSFEFLTQWDVNLIVNHINFFKDGQWNLTLHWNLKFQVSQNKFPWI